jgi:hypothetical protein
MKRFSLTTHKLTPLVLPLPHVAASVPGLGHLRKPWKTQGLLNGADETRTRDLRRDRAIPRYSRVLENRLKRRTDTGFSVSRCQAMSPNRYDSPPLVFPLLFWDIFPLRVGAPPIL